MNATKSGLGLALMLSVGLLATSSEAAAAQEGQKQTDRLIKRGESAMKEVGTTQQQILKTLTLYNSIIESTSNDVRKSYRDLVKSLEDSEKKADDVGKRVEEMEVEAHKFFEEWTKNTEGIASENLRVRSQERLNEARLQYGDALREGRRARAEFDIFVQTMHDQIVFLGYDLNATAVASLKEDAAKLNKQADELFQKIDEVVEMTNSYLDSLRPQ